MILDTYRDGCNIWIGEHVTSINGSPFEVCEQIYMRTIIPRETNSGVVCDQLYEISIDIGGTNGMTYKHILNDMGIKTTDIRSKNVDVILPIRTTSVHHYNVPEFRCDNIFRYRRK